MFELLCDITRFGESMAMRKLQFLQKILENFTVGIATSCSTHTISMKERKISICVVGLEKTVFRYIAAYTLCKQSTFNGK